MLLPNAGFFLRGVLPSGKKTLPASVVALLWMLAFLGFILIIFGPTSTKPLSRMQNGYNDAFIRRQQCYGRRLQSFPPLESNG